MPDIQPGPWTRGGVSRALKVTGFSCQRYALCQRLSDGVRERETDLTTLTKLTFQLSKNQYRRVPREREEERRFVITY